MCSNEKTQSRYAELFKLLKEDTGIIPFLRKAAGTAGPVAEVIFDELLSKIKSDGQSFRKSPALQIASISSLRQNYYISLEDLSSTYSKVDPSLEGAESLLFLSRGEDSFIIKAQDYSIHSETPLDYLVNRIILHNVIFPYASYQLHGFTLDEVSNKFRFLVSQDFIQGEAASQKDITSFMNSLGFSQVKSV